MSNVPEVREDDNVLTVPLVHVEVRLTHAQHEVDEPRLVHVSRVEWSNVSARVLCPIDDHPNPWERFKKFKSFQKYATLCLKSYRCLGLKVDSLWVISAGRVAHVLVERALDEEEARFVKVLKMMTSAQFAPKDPRSRSLQWNRKGTIPNNFKMKYRSYYHEEKILALW